MNEHTPQIPFFDRPRDYVCLAQSTWHPYLPWLLPLPFVIIGFLLHGETIFTWEYWSKPHSIRYHPIISIPLFAGVFVWGLYRSLDNFLGRPCRIGTLDGYLLINRRTAIALNELNLAAAKLSDSGKVVEIPYSKKPGLILKLQVHTTARATALLTGIHNLQPQA